MASIKGHKSSEMGLHEEVLTGRTQQVFFNPEESENFFYHDAYDVDFNKRTEIDAKDIECLDINRKIKELMSQGYGTIVIKNPPSFNIFLEFSRVTNRSSIVKCSSVAYKIIASNFLFNFPISTDEDSKNSISRSYNFDLNLAISKDSL